LTTKRKRKDRNLRLRKRRPENREKEKRRPFAKRLRVNKKPFVPQGKPAL
jgi:hypothetical protein